MREDLVLAIETSCDDTSVALVYPDGRIEACETVSQFAIHAEYGGVFPELASRAHLQAILPTVDKVMSVIDHDIDRISAIGVTRGPGLIGSLLVGIHAAQGLALGWRKPIYGVNHLHGHLRSADLEQERVIYPAILLLVSGGHTLIAHLSSPTDIKLLGHTRDDSVGETYDKVARMLDLGMPGGPKIDREAKLGAPILDFPRPMIGSGYEFSFSGLKSSVARLLEKDPSYGLQDVAASFVEACLDVLIAKSARAIKEYSPASLTVVGGVAASPQLRERMERLCAETGTLLSLPPLKWSTDNAAMIGLATWDLIRSGTQPSAEANPALRLGQY